MGIDLSLFQLLLVKIRSYTHQFTNFTLRKVKLNSKLQALKLLYYIDTDKIPGFLQWRKFGIQWRYEFYLSHCEDIIAWFFR